MWSARSPSFVRVVPDLVRRPPAPARRLAVDVDQLVAVIEDVIGDAIDHPAQRRLLVVGGDQVVVDRIDEVVADDLVGARVRLPAPLLVWRVVPFAVGRLNVDAGLDEGTRRKARDAGDLFETHDGLHAALRVVARVSGAGHLETERLGGDVDRRPEPVVVRRSRAVRREIAGHLELRVCGQAPAKVAVLHALDEDRGLFRQGHRHVVDFRHTAGRFDPRGGALRARCRSRDRRAASAGRRNTRACESRR